MTKKTILVLFIFCSLFAKQAKAQWSITTWPQTSYDFEQTFLQFLNADTAYGLVADLQKIGTKYVAKPVFVRTKDQGQTWDSISSSDSAGGNFYFFDYAHGVTSGYNSIYRTKDSGKTWQKAANADTIYLFSSFSPKLTFAYGSSKIYKSADSGKTWNVVLNTSVNYLTNGQYNYMSFTDSLHGYLLGIDENNNGVIYKTIDGGNTWSYIYPPKNSYFQSVQFLTTSIAYGIDVLDKSGKNDYEVMKSIDSGHTWFSVNNGISGFIVSIAFTDSLTGYAVIADSLGTNEIYKTSDGGKLWNFQQDLGHFPNGDYTIGSFLHFINPNIGYFYNNYSTGNKNIAFTTNGGGITTGIKPNKETFNFKVYPNPSQSAFILSATLPNNSPAVLSIYDIAGKLVSSQVLQPTIQGTLNQQISTSNLSAGYYMVSLEQSGNRITGKMLKD